MKYIYFFIIIFSVLFIYGCECKDEDMAEPDLAFKTWESIYNPCIGNYEYLDTRNLYWTPVLGTGGQQWVLLYYRDVIGQEGFYDCYGVPWFIGPGGTQLVSYRYVENVPDFSRECTKDAPQPAAQGYTTVVDPNSNDTTEYEGPIVIFNDIPPGQSRELNTVINITIFGIYINEYRVDPIDEVLERDENNNFLRDTDFDVGRMSSTKSSFEIKPFDIQELKKKSEPFVVYKEGVAERYN